MDFHTKHLVIAQELGDRYVCANCFDKKNRERVASDECERPVQSKNDLLCHRKEIQDHVNMRILT